MTADRRAALVEKVAQAMAVCEGYDTNNHFIVGSFKDSAEAAIDLIRAEVLEEAARVADEYDGNGILWDNAAVACYEIAAAIRALKEKKGGPNDPENR